MYWEQLMYMYRNSLVYDKMKLFYIITKTFLLLIFRIKVFLNIRGECNASKEEDSRRNTILINVGDAPLELCCLSQFVALPLLLHLFLFLGCFLNLGNHFVFQNKDEMRWEWENIIHSHSVFIACEFKKCAFTYFLFVLSDNLHIAVPRNTMR